MQERLDRIRQTGTEIKPEESEERYAYYRRCQVFRKNGQQCKAPAVKGEELCHRHQEQLDAGRRRKRLTLPPLVDLKTVQRSIGDVAQALIEDRIDAKHAGELLEQLQMASLRLRPQAAGQTRAEVTNRDKFQFPPPSFILGDEEL